MSNNNCEQTEHTDALRDRLLTLALRDILREILETRYSDQKNGWNQQVIPPYTIYCSWCDKENETGRIDVPCARPECLGARAWAILGRAERKVTPENEHAPAG